MEMISNSCEFSDERIQVRISVIVADNIALAKIVKIIVYCHQNFEENFFQFS